MAITYKKNVQNVYKVPFMFSFGRGGLWFLALAVLSFGAGAGCID